MLEKPDIDDALILSGLRSEFKIQAGLVTFLPIGYDVNTAVYRVVAKDGTSYFLKLRKGKFDEVAVALPKLLHARGVRAVISPLESQSRRLWGSLGDYKMILYPYIAGEDGYQRKLSKQQWLEFGATLRRVHAAKVPKALSERIPREAYSPVFRDMVSAFMEMIEHVVFADPVAHKLATFMRSKQEEIGLLVSRGKELAQRLLARQVKMVLCHSDLHAGNLLLPDENSLYIVDWDNPIFAPREKDLALLGGSPAWNSPREIAHFYRGYRNKKRLELDMEALAYYRCERAVTDIAEFCRSLLLTDAGGADREQSYTFFTGQFLPGHEVDLALETAYSSTHDVPANPPIPGKRKASLAGP